MVVAQIIFGLVFFAGVFIAPKQSTTVVLLPDPDGSVGTVEVATAAGSITLNEAGQMTRVADSAAPPAEVTLASEQELQRRYAAVLAAEPPQPVKFILYFAQDSTQLLADSEAQIPAILLAIRQRDSYAIGIYGHSDRTGSDEYNLKLSLGRALAVRKLLADEGVAPEYMDTSSHGEGNPLVPTADQVAEPRNRRVEVIVR